MADKTEFKVKYTILNVDKTNSTIKYFMEDPQLILLMNKIYTHTYVESELTPEHLQSIHKVANEKLPEARKELFDFFQKNWTERNFYIPVGLTE